ncbi:hypothetical protein TTHERM_00127130 (macronuclear) [Tetrahymena thermophila SB210]|uniref:Uncharacterized protein n=1 Tax=Tetrahymena thermophila (strain SB210) TaxID=312017 RepID=I7MEC1_TETTS|nr:hypothetical protein TTHERM_00127130 [Tetrahymena thermophila SB210]EAR96048.1 hypothetical protein TTHERM_00127130 [Tetrahymena thermophila SB210]|eukprot:XP_001016293.1 hypothetical protein TTHERM_00127130 [Tetrahymena thermophila SB210]
MIDTIKENYLKNSIEIQEELSTKAHYGKNLEVNQEKMVQESYLQANDQSITQGHFQYDKQIELAVPLSKKEFDIQKINTAIPDIQNHKISQQKIQNSSILNPNYYNQSSINPSRILGYHNKIIPNKQQYNKIYENHQPEEHLKPEEINNRYSRYQFQPPLQQFQLDQQQIIPELSEDKSEVNAQMIFLPNQNLKTMKISNDISNYNYTPQQLEYKGQISKNINQNIQNPNQLNQNCFSGNRENFVQRQYFNRYNNQYERIGVDTSNDRYNQNYMLHAQMNQQKNLIHPGHEPEEDDNLEQKLILTNQEFENLKNTLQQKKVLLEMKQKIRQELVRLIQKESNNLQDQKEFCQQLLQAIQDCLDLEQRKREIQSQLFVNLEEQEDIQKKIQQQKQKSATYKANKQGENKTNSADHSTQLQLSSQASLIKPLQDDNIKLEYDASEKQDKNIAISLAENGQTNSDQNSSQFVKLSDKQQNQNFDDNQLKSTEIINQIGESQSNHELQQNGILIKKESENADHPIILNNHQYQFNQAQYENALQRKINYCQQFENKLQQNYLEKIINPCQAFPHSALSIICQKQNQIHPPPPPYQFETKEYLYSNYQSQQIRNHESLLQGQQQLNQNLDPLQIVIKEEHNAACLNLIGNRGEGFGSKQVSSMIEENQNNSNTAYNKNESRILDISQQSFQVVENQIKIEQANNDYNLDQQTSGKQTQLQRIIDAYNKTQKFKETHGHLSKLKKQIEKKPKKYSDTKDLIRFRKGQEKDIQIASFQKLSESELQKKLQFHNQLKIFMLQSSKYIKEQISLQIKIVDNEANRVINEQHIRYLDAFKNRFTKSDLSHFLKEIDEISFDEIDENMKELDSKLKLIKQRKITYIITIIKSFTNLEQFKQIFPEENSQIFEQNSTYLSQYLLDNPIKIQEINQYIGKINYFNKTNRMYLQRYCLFQLGITACKKKASKLDQLYIKNYVLQMLSNPSNIE